MPKDPLSPGRVSEFFSGLALPFSALRMVLGTPKLLLLSLLCALVTCAALVGLFFGLWELASGLGSRWVGEGGWRTAASFGLSLVLFVAMFAVGALTVPSLLLAPLQDPLSEATEEKLGGFTAPPFSFSRLVSGALVSAGHTLARLALMLVGFGVLLPLNLIPVAGSIAYTALSVSWAAWWVAVEYLSGPMARHLLSFRAVLGAMRRRPWRSMGMGASLYVVLWVPVLNFLLVPLAVVAGTLLFRRLEADGQISLPAGT